ncbi:polyribonucleotide nucleotidyltransferase [Candidatus Woesebacteria bacterium]|nr:polyribonucleotide nucleotidyltransferase [Candidatus Woesebacteria bacterium]
MKQTTKTFDLNGKTLTLQTGVLAEQATSSVLARLGDTMVVATIVMSERDTSLDYFPLSVEYVERLYAGGRIKGSKWVKREGRPTDDAILTARLIDRSIRPLFPKELKKDIQVIITVLAVDGENDPEVLAGIAVSAALSISKIPWNGPISTIRVGIVGDNETKDIIVNPRAAEGEFLELDLVVSGTAEKTVMIEAAAKQVPESTVLEAIKVAKEWNGKLITFINELVAEVGEKKVAVTADSDLQEAIMLVEKSYKDKVLAFIEGGVAKENVSGLGEIADEIVAHLGEDAMDKKKVIAALDYIFKKTIRERLLKGTRPDGRKLDQVRPISAQVGLVPRVHGSGLFSRGQTQVLTIATLGSSAMEQIIESAEGEETRRFFHHYSFPPYSVGETGRIGSPNRREIGHGALAEKSIVPVLPDATEFPYVIRLVSEVMSSNGSTSQGSVCGSTLALMDAGVPIKAPVAGIAMGIVTDGDAYTLLTDIIGLEDFSGEMDFKVAGTTNGITSIQLDVKNAGINIAMIEDALNGGQKARVHILDEMLKAIAEPRKELSEFAPKIQAIKIPVEKIGEVIGSGGKTIKNIIATTGAEVDVADDGTVSISGTDPNGVQSAIHWIQTLTRELQKNEEFEGTVKRLLAFGAFVELVPGKEGMVHVSEMSAEYVKDPADLVQVGQTVKVRVKEVDDQGRINLSMLFGEDAEKKDAASRDSRTQEKRHQEYTQPATGDRSGSRPPYRGSRDRSDRSSSRGSSDRRGRFDR